jgi:DNA-binding transcriptional ArsR family regulator
MRLLEVLFPKGRARLLKVLCATPNTELHLRELTRQSGLSLATIQEELEKLRAADLVLSRRDGNRRYYKANSSHPIFPDLRQIVLKTAALGDVLADALRGIKEVDLAFVFGSLAGQDGNASSDVDLMVIGSAGLRTLAPGLRKASEKIGREINPHTYTKVDWRSKRRARNGFLKNVMESEKLFVKGSADELARLG